MGSSKIAGSRQKPRERSRSRERRKTSRSNSRQSDVKKEGKTSSRSSSAHSSKTDYDRKSSKKAPNKKKRRRDSSSTSSSSSSDTEARKRSKRKAARTERRARRRLLRKAKKRKARNARGLEVVAFDKPASSSVPEPLEDNSEEMIGPDPKMMQRHTMKPMSKEEWDKQQSVLRHVYDPESGRTRLIKGDGEVMEEIVTYEQHLEINKKATEGDGATFQAKLGLQKKTLFDRTKMTSSTSKKT